MRTAAYNDDVASDRRRRQNVPRHILCSTVYPENGKSIRQNLSMKIPYFAKRFDKICTEKMIL